MEPALVNLQSSHNGQKTVTLSMGLGALEVLDFFSVGTNPRFSTLSKALLKAS